MEKIIFLLFIYCIFFPLSVNGASSLMVERHIFTPKSDGKGAYRSPLSLKLEKNLMFTGVIISSKGRWAIIRETGKMNEEKVSGLRKEGDEIMGMVIKKIGSNFLIMSGEGKEVRLNLYQEGKPRPSLPEQSASPSALSEDTQALTPVASPRSNSPITGTRSTGPHAQTSSPPSQLPEAKKQGTSAHPFLKQAQNPFLKKNPNPFLKNPSPNSDVTSQ